MRNGNRSGAQARVEPWASIVPAFGAELRSQWISTRPTVVVEIYDDSWANPDDSSKEPPWFVALMDRIGRLRADWSRFRISPKDHSSVWTALAHDTAGRASRVA